MTRLTFLEKNICYPLRYAKVKSIFLYGNRKIYSWLENKSQLHKYKSHSFIIDKCRCSSYLVSPSNLVRQKLKTALRLVLDIWPRQFLTTVELILNHPKFHPPNPIGFLFNENVPIIYRGDTSRKRNYRRNAFDSEIPTIKT